MHTMKSELESKGVEELRAVGKKLSQAKRQSARDTSVVRICNWDNATKAALFSALTYPRYLVSLPQSLIRKVSVVYGGIFLKPLQPIPISRQFICVSVIYNYNYSSSCAFLDNRWSSSITSTFVKTLFNLISYL